MKLFSRESGDPKTNAQRNLMGRTHYVDDATLRFHASRVISTHISDGGMLFGLVSSDAVDYQKTRRGFRYVIFDVFGTVIERNPSSLEAEWFKTSEKARIAMWAALNALDAKEITRQGADRARGHFLVELDHLLEKIETIETVPPKRDED